jgi:phosphatidylinositol-3,4,5-trisphosphate 3-phosphatase/dual-specificity protein phosphatase PTEN
MKQRILNKSNKKVTPSSFLRKMVSKKKNRYNFDGTNLDLTYITESIIAMGFPSTSTESMWRNPREEVKRFLQ